MASPSLPIEVSADGSGFRWVAEGGDPVAEAFHAVRRMTYASTGSRDPVDLVRTGRGACTAKHLLLCQLLHGMDVPARVLTVSGSFGADLPAASGMPEALKAMIGEGGVPDFHNVVEAEVGSETVMLDATWHDAMAAVGFPVNSDWQGRGSTRLAVRGAVVDGGAANPVDGKAALIAAMPAQERERRRRFLDLITQYSLAQTHTSEGRV